MIHPGAKIQRIFLCAVFVFLATISIARAEQSAAKVLDDLRSKRESIPGVHQEFESSQSFVAIHGTQTSHGQVIVDLAGKKWRERTASGAGNRVRIFDGNDLILLDEEDSEYTRVKRKGKEDDQGPAPYGSVELDLAKARELGRQPCGFSSNDHTCILFDVPLKGWSRIGEGHRITRMTAGHSRFAIDSENGHLSGGKRFGRLAHLFHFSLIEPPR
jgi:hypothetical protein